MYSIKDKTLTIQGQTTSIERWEVWFQTPFGLIENLDDAIIRVESSDCDPNFTIVPVVVAIAGSRYEVISK
jgi:hypothetical protein